MGNKSTKYKEKIYPTFVKFNYEKTCNNRW
ncbi:hypothetical protein CPAV1605_917 [seawater metagenome]|uniref:Uncharacterized protein n=1 Tax=seawater metagenome TaxID=1561972 RepID=A0A5E8CM04_9ZZZZ